MMRTDMGVLGIEAPQHAAVPPARRLSSRLLRLLLRSTEPKVRTLRHVETLALGPRRMLHLVECDGERFLVTAGDGVSAPVPLTQRFAVRDRDALRERNA